MYIPVKPIYKIQCNTYQNIQHLSYGKLYPNQKEAQAIVNSESLISHVFKPACFYLSLESHTWPE